jgi:hypothetical protein
LVARAAHLFGQKRVFWFCFVLSERRGGSSPKKNLTQRGEIPVFLLPRRFARTIFLDIRAAPDPGGPDKKF